MVYAPYFALLPSPAAKTGKQTEGAEKRDDQHHQQPGSLPTKISTTIIRTRSVWALLDKIDT